VVAVHLLDSSSEPAIVRTNVRLEIAYQGDAVYSGGSSSAGVVASSGNWLANASHAGRGVYRTVVRPVSGWAQRASVGIAVMIETEDADGTIEDSAQCRFWAAVRHVTHGWGTRSRRCCSSAWHQGRLRFRRPYLRHCLQPLYTRLQVSASPFTLAFATPFNSGACSSPFHSCSC
jgi:hypothetical protein